MLKYSILVKDFQLSNFVCKWQEVYTYFCTGHENLHSRSRPTSYLSSTVALGIWVGSNEQVHVWSHDISHAQYSSYISYGAISSGKLGDSCAAVKCMRYEPSVKDHVVIHLGINKGSFTHNCVCMVNGSNARAAICVLLLFPLI